MLTLGKGSRKVLSREEMFELDPECWWVATNVKGTQHVLAKVKVKSLSGVWLFATPWTVAHQAPPSMGFSRQEYWSGLPFPSPGESSWPGDLPDPGIEPGSPALQADALPLEPPGKPWCVVFHPVPRCVAALSGASDEQDWQWRCCAVGILPGDGCLNFAPLAIPPSP